MLELIFHEPRKTSRSNMDISKMLVGPIRGRRKSSPKIYLSIQFKLRNLIFINQRIHRHINSGKPAIPSAFISVFFFFRIWMIHICYMYIYILCVYRPHGPPVDDPSKQMPSHLPMKPSFVCYKIQHYFTDKNVFDLIFEFSLLNRQKLAKIIHPSGPIRFQNAGMYLLFIIILYESRFCQARVSFLACRRSEWRTAHT